MSTPDLMKELMKELDSEVAFLVKLCAATAEANRTAEAALSRENAQASIVRSIFREIELRAKGKLAEANGLAELRARLGKEMP